MNFLVNSKVKTQAAPSRGIKMNAEMAITGQKRTGCSQLSQSKMHCTNNSLQALRVTPELVSLVRTEGQAPTPHDPWVQEFSWKRGWTAAQGLIQALPLC